MWIGRDRSGPIIKVFGVGDVGSNAVEYMFEKQIVGVEFCYINTDRQALKKSKVGTLLQIGEAVTSGSGTGGKPEIGCEAAFEDRDVIAEHIDGADMLFIIAGMGGGTGTGAAPMIACIAKEMGVLTVVVVSKPCLTEGGLTQVVVEGLDELLKYVDTLIDITPGIAVESQGDAMPMGDVYNICNEAFYNAVSSVSDLMTLQAFADIDFADVRTVLSGGDMGLMGRISSALVSGPDRARIATEQAVAKLLVEGVDLANVCGILVNITTSSSSFRMKEYYDVLLTIKASFTAAEAIWAISCLIDENMADGMRVTIVARLEAKNEHLALFLPLF